MTLSRLPPTPLSRLQLLAMACMFISAKNDEVFRFDLKTMIALSAQRVSADDILMWESRVLHLLQYQVSSPSPINILHALLELCVHVTSVAPRSSLCDELYGSDACGHTQHARAETKLANAEKALFGCDTSSSDNEELSETAQKGGAKEQVKEDEAAEESSLYYRKVLANANANKRTYFALQKQAKHCFPRALAFYAADCLDFLVCLPQSLKFTPFALVANTLRLLLGGNELSALSRALGTIFEANEVYNEASKCTTTQLNWLKSVK